jgi:hypothetical protein
LGRIRKRVGGRKSDKGMRGLEKRVGYRSWSGEEKGDGWGGGDTGEGCGEGEGVG